MVVQHGRNHSKDMLPPDTVYQDEMSGNAPQFFYVSADNGSDTEGDGTYTKPFATIQHVIDTVGTGTFISIIIDETVYEIVTVPTGTWVSIVSMSGFVTFQGGLRELNIEDDTYVYLDNLYVNELNFSTFPRATALHLYIEECWFGGTNSTAFRIDDELLISNGYDWGPVIDAAQLAPCNLNAISFPSDPKNDPLRFANPKAEFDGELTIPDPTADEHADTKGARDSAISTGISDHVAEGDPHTQYQLESEKGAVNGYAPLGADQKVPAVNLPSYVDDVLEYADYASLPVTGETGKIYVTLDDNKQYRWSGSAYIEVSPTEGPATGISTSTTNFDHALSASEDELQKVCEKLDDQIILAIQPDGGALTKRFQMRNRVSYVNGGLSYNLNTPMPNLTDSAPPTINVSIVDTADYDEDINYVAYNKLVWDTDHWQLTINVTKINTTGPIANFAEAATDEVAVHIHVEGY